MKAVILAAGVASRLRPLTNNTPKCLLKVGPKNILELALENLVENKISDIVIVTGYLENRIRDFLKIRFPELNITFCYNELYNSTNNIYSLWLARNALQGEEMLLMDSDIVFDSRIITRLISSGFKSCLALKRHEVHDEEIKVRTDMNGRILEISKEVNPAEAAGESVGIELFGKDLLSELFRVIDRKVNIDKNVNQFYEAAFQELIDNNHDIYAVDVTEYFCTEIDTEEDLRNAGDLYNKQGGA
ncbi:MAG TPA: nucleotidyl transferase [Bacteroidales bacterium]|nr:nucleotidyl transferase [Bacteroidales bacterium]